MKKELIILLLLLIAAVNGQDSLYDYQDLTLDLRIDSGFMLQGSSGSELNYMKVMMYLYPESGMNQEVLYISTEPDYVEKEDYLELMWAENRLGQYDYSLESRIKTQNRIKEIKQKIRFPLGEIDPEYEYYLTNTEKIDINDDIIEKASELAEGEDDLYQVVFNLAEWTLLNIDYNITTLTADASEPSSWVLENRYGVCDEITNLFISFCRSLGIPARFVSGISYSNTDTFENDWGLHGWAEVYFPGHGWVSFDPTYGQFGFVDATHIKLRHSIDSDKSSTKFEWQGIDVSLETDETDIDVVVSDYGDLRNDRLEIGLYPLVEETGLDSYNLIEARVRNLNDFYVSTELILSKAMEVGLHDSRAKYVLLGPNQEKSVYWIVDVEDLNENYVYTFPLEVFDSFGNSKKSNFKSRENGVEYSYEQVHQILQNRIEQEVKSYSRNIDLACSYPTSVYYNESFDITCAITNKGNVMLGSLRVCLDTDCSTTRLGISQTKNITFSKTIDTIGSKEIMIMAKNSDVTKSAQLSLVVEDRPEISIQNVEHPPKLEFGPDFDISFELHKESIAAPKDAKILFYFNNKESIWQIDEIDSVQKFNIQLDRSILDAEDNNIMITVEYKDKESNIYKKEFEKTIPIEEPNLWQKIVMKINCFLRKF